MTDAAPTAERYSTPEEIGDFVQAVAATAKPAKGQDEPAHKPMIVNDMDGNILVGYNLVKGQSIPADYKQADWAEGQPREGILNPKNQTIPFDADVGALVNQGIVEKVLFADANMDVRLPEAMVQKLNSLIDQGRTHELALLTSRSLE